MLVDVAYPRYPSIGLYDLVIMNAKEDGSAPNESNAVIGLVVEVEPTAKMKGKVVYIHVPTHLREFFTIGEKVQVKFRNIMRFNGTIMMSNDMGFVERAEEGDSDE